MDEECNSVKGVKREISSRDASSDVQCSEGVNVCEQRCEESAFRGGCRTWEKRTLAVCTPTLRA